VCVALGTLSVSGTLVLPTAFEPGRVLRLLRDTKSTIFGGVPTMMLDLLGHPELPDTDLSALRVVQTGGATVAPALVRRIEETLDVKVNVAYGQSEAPWTLMTLPDDPDVVKAETLGHPLPHREMRIVRLDDHATARHGQIGELWIRSPLNMTRYAGEATLTTETLDTDGWLHTGDLCSMDADGIVRIHGRSHDVIIRGGENLYPREIEQVLNAHPAVADSAVIGKPDERWGETVAAFIRLHPGSTVTTHDLDIYARCHLATHKVPRTWRVVESLPLTASGKVKKHVLKEELSRREPVEDGTG
jgi:fatty-acyl-CoA synthase